MKKRIRDILIILSYLFLTSRPMPLYAQKTALKIGDQVPNIVLNNVVGYKTTSLRLTDFKGKLLILDFWATWCASCISSMPKLDSLQAKYKGRLQVISVTHQKREVIEAFKQKNPIARAFKAPMITGDKKLSELFHHRALPHLAWISSKGEFIGTSVGFDATSKSIMDLLKAYLPPPDL